MPAPPPRAPTFPAFIDEAPLDSKTSDPTPNMTSETPNGDSVPVVPLPVAQSKSKIRAILLWRDPKVSGGFFGVCLLFFYLTLMKGLSVLSVIGMLGMVYFVLGTVVVKLNAQMGGKLDAYIARPPAGTPLFRREGIDRLLDTVMEEGNEIAEEIRNVLYCEKPAVSAGMTFIALLVYFAGNVFSFLTVLFVCTLAVFTLPLIYEKNKKQVDEAVAKASDVASRHMETAGRMAQERAIQVRDVVAEKSAPLLEKAPPMKNLADRIGLTPKAKPE